MKRATILMLALLCAGCIETKVAESPSGPDQCLRREIFQECMRALPAGPVSAKYNDWDEVVEACSSAAYYQSLRTLSQIKPECKV